MVRSEDRVLLAAVPIAFVCAMYLSGMRVTPVVGAVYGPPRQSRIGSAHGLQDRSGLLPAVQAATPLMRAIVVYSS